jgi:hypothetical protein
VTFVGANVGGNVPSIALIDSGALTGIGAGMSCQEAIASDCELDGDELTGTVSLGYSDSNVAFTAADSTATWPGPAAIGLAPSGASASSAIPFSAKPADVAAALNAMPCFGAGAVTVTRVLSGGPGATWMVTWMAGERSVGNLAKMTIAANTLALPGGSGTASVSVTEIQDGTFLSGQFRLGLLYDTPAVAYTSMLDWDASDTTVAAALSALSTGVGTIEVQRTRYLAGNDWTGGFEWSITFRSIAKDLPTLDVSSGTTLDADIRAGHTASASVAVVEERKRREVQVIRTVASHTDEIQRVTISGTDVDEVQTITLSIGGGVGPPTGSFQLQFDTTTGCNLCSPANRISRVTLSIGIAAAGSEAQKASDLAALVKARLEQLDNIDDVTTVGTVYSSGASMGYTIAVTFSGRQVGGNVPMLTVVSPSATPAAWTTSVVETTPGAEVTGTLTLTATDAAGYPLPADQAGEGLTALGALTTSSLSATATAAAVKAEIDAVGVVGTVSVEQAATGGPGAAWDITFASGARARGDKALLVCTPALSAGAACDVSERVRGTFLSGQFSVQLAFEDAASETAPLDWHASASAMGSALGGLYHDQRLGSIQVSRTQYLPTGRLDDWDGAFEWAVTFSTLDADVPELTFKSQLKGLGASVGDGGAGVSLGASQTVHGSYLGEVNDVQLIECACAAACSGAIRLSWRDEQTAGIAHTATASQVRAALLELGAIDGIAVQMAGGTTLCDSDGVTTAVTFTHFVGKAPPLRISPGDSEAFTLASSVAGGLDFGLVDATRDEVAGIHGFRARGGTRRREPCSGRGKCSTRTGECSCAVDQSGQELFTRSDGGGGDVNPSSGKIANCGLPVAVSECPFGSESRLTCSGHGACSQAPLFRCQCHDGFAGEDCSEGRCGTHLSWFDEAYAPDAAHRGLATCSDRGICQSGLGRCLCERGFEGAACQLGACPFSLPLVPVPGVAGYTSCGGAGQCRTMADLASVSIDSSTGSPITGARYASPWDAHKVQGCACDRFVYTGPRGSARSNATGPSCLERSCPRGADPKAPARHEAVDEVQSIACAASAGSLQVSFFGIQSVAVPFDAYVLESQNTATPQTSLESAVGNMSSVGLVHVSFVEPDPFTFSDADRKLCTTTKSESTRVCVIASQQCHAGRSVDARALLAENRHEWPSVVRFV